MLIKVNMILSVTCFFLNLKRKTATAIVVPNKIARVIMGPVRLDEQLVLTVISI